MDWTFEKKVAGEYFVHVRLDRVLASANWCAHFPFVVVQHLMAAKSDHCPILLSSEPEERGRLLEDSGSLSDMSLCGRQIKDYLLKSSKFGKMDNTVIL